MDTNVYTYEGDDVTVTWDQERCIHAQACVDGLPTVFDPERRPWIEPDQATPDAVEAVVPQCPTGALHLTRNGDDPEPTPDENRISLFPNGPLLVHGDAELIDSDGETLLTDTRMALCRCGKSSNKPLCDGSHDGDFEDAGHIAVDHLSPPDDGETDTALRIRATEDGPFVVEGPVTIEGADEETVSGHRGALCRCGASGSKPFCDGSHAEVDFEAG
ncbi:MAG: CDGSH iron-sulfur domain-containing protein [Salinibacter sp.]|uniref:CDGSH iron-sulfur domain-containing protein n=1 Tax=Salinibacter sp. TaxID=2065818 RepID=UPI002FC30FFA